MKIYSAINSKNFLQDLIGNQNDVSYQSIDGQWRALSQLAD